MQRSIISILLVIFITVGFGCDPTTGQTNANSMAEVPSKPSAQLTALQNSIRNYDLAIQKNLIRYVGFSAERQRRIEKTLTPLYNDNAAATLPTINEQLASADFDNLRKFFEARLQKALNNKENSAEIIKEATALANVAALGNPRASKAAYQLISQAAPNNIIGWLGLCEFNLLLNDNEAALEAFEKARGLLTLNEKPSANSNPAQSQNIIKIDLSTLSDLSKAWYYTLYGKLLRINRQWFDAEQALQMSLQIYQQKGLFAQQADIYSELGDLFIEQKDWLPAQSYLQKSIELNEIMDRKLALAHGYSQMGLTYKGNSQWSAAVGLFNDSLNFHKTLNFPGGQASNYGNLGIVYRNMQKYEESESMYQAGLNIDLELDFKEGAAIKYTNLGVLYYQQSKLDKAESVLRNSLELFKELRLTKQTRMVEAYLTDLNRQLNMASGQNESQ